MIEHYWVIKIFIETKVRYFYNYDDEKMMYGNDPFVAGMYTSTKFKSYDDALTKLKEGREKYHWGGVFQIEEIYISR
jgi:hypothetical protein